MAKVVFTPSGFLAQRGTMGKAVYRMQGDETIVCRRPLRTDQEPSEAQLAVRERFRDAIEYGKDAMYDPDLRSIYEEKARSRSRWKTRSAWRNRWASAWSRSRPLRAARMESEILRVHLRVHPYISAAQ